jgi:hypothetical protein
MNRSRLFAGLAGLFASSLAATALAAPAFSDAVRANAATLRERALKDDTAHELVRSLTTEVGPRLAGSPGDAKAVAWATAKLAALGFKDVRTEPVKIPHWERGMLVLETLGGERRALAAASLGGSVGTDGKPLEAEVVNVPSLADLARLDRARVAGRIVFFSHRMPELLDGSGYGRNVPIRTRGAAEAAKLGAVGVVIRSVGTDADTPHTGAMRYKDGVPKIPAVAIAGRDADRLEAELDAGQAVRLRLVSTARKLEDTLSHNVIGEIPGRTPEFVLLGAHLDSWDLGTGAHDDGAGVALVTAAARLIGQLREPPRRGLRVVLFANEEFGLSGAYAYAVAHAGELERHALAIEADLGGGRVWGLASRFAPERVPVARAMANELASLGIRYYDNRAGGGADIGPLRELGVPVLDLRHDASKYFRLHHTPADTLDAIDPAELKQALAAYAMTAYLAAESADGFGRLAPRIETDDQ